MSGGIKDIVKAFVPPVLVDLLKPRAKFGWRGDFKTWDEADKQCSGYSATNIVEKVKAATLKVKHGDKAYERDSVNFDSIQYSWPLLSALMWVAAKNKGSLKMLDIGGSLGSSYFQNRHFLEDIDVEWNIVEQAAFVETGQQFFQDQRLKFYDSTQECIAANGIPDIVLLSCVLPYIQMPYVFLEKALALGIPHLVIDNTFFNYEERDRIVIQKVDPRIYEASYPCWFLNYEAVKNLVKTKYNIRSEYANDLTISFNGHKIHYQGLLALKK